MIKQKLSQSNLNQLQVVLSLLIGNIFDARIRYLNCQNLKPGKLAGLSKYLKKLRALPHNADYSIHEQELKRRLIQASHKLNGFGDKREYCVMRILPFAVYGASMENFETALNKMLKQLADVKVNK